MGLFSDDDEFVLEAALVLEAPGTATGWYEWLQLAIPTSRLNARTLRVTANRFRRLERDFRLDCRPNTCSDSDDLPHRWDRHCDNARNSRRTSPPAPPFRPGFRKATMWQRQHCAQL